MKKGSTRSSLMSLLAIISGLIGILYKAPIMTENGIILAVVSVAYAINFKPKE